VGQFSGVAKGGCEMALGHVPLLGGGRSDPGAALHQPGVENGEDRPVAAYSAMSG
jgi:hypothetical protein